MGEGAAGATTAEAAKARPGRMPSAGFLEDFEARYPRPIMETLLADRTTGRNIIWADSEYEALGAGYAPGDEITYERISGTSSGVVKPRVAKAAERQSARTRTRAEVFTPSWLVNQMANALDEGWFRHPGAFNAESDGGWDASPGPVAFPKAKGRGWHAYVESRRLEITCGEAPFLCSRYDAATGTPIAVAERVGVLDRKLRVVGTAADLFGDKVYADIGDELDDVIDSITTGEGTHDEEDRFLDGLRETFSAGIAQPLVERAREEYGDAMRPGQQRRVERRIKADVDIELNRQVGDYRIQRNMIEAERARALDAAETQEEADAADARAEVGLADARAKLVEGLRDSRDTLVHGAGETVVREVETAKREAKKADIEGGIRDHLRGFSRTIPSFLMAYGDDTPGREPTLATFDAIIPAEVFREVTSITVEQFRFLRDGGDFTDAQGNVGHFDGHLFDPVVFDDSVKEFLRLLGELANYFDEGQEEDIFDYVPPQRTNQIFTPKRVVREMVDLFEAENPGCFDDPEHTFADLYMKPGLFVAEVVRRLYNSEGMRAAIPDDAERLQHILERQVFGVAPTRIIYEIATHFILGYHDEVGRGAAHNFWCEDTAELARDGRLEAWVEEEFGGKL